MRSRSSFGFVRAGGLALVLGVLVALTACDRADEYCVQCGRDECRNVAVVVHLADGERVSTCCPRCALHYLEETKAEVARIEVRAFDTSRALDARTAVYVEGSDVHPCAATHDGPPKDERGCCLKPVYDRCLPSVLAFGDARRADAFAREHGGFVTSFAALSAGRADSNPTTR